MLAIGLALLVAAVPDQSLPSGSKASSVALLRPCACASDQDYHWCKWIRSTVELANPLALRKADWNLERTVLSRLPVSMHLGLVVHFTEIQHSWQLLGVRLRFLTNKKPG